MSVGTMPAVVKSCRENGSMRALVMWAALLASAIVPAGCQEPPVDEISADILANLDYRSEYVSQGSIQLHDGRYSAAIIPGGATRLHIQLVTYSAGDLNKDGTWDAAVVLASDPGGSGTFYDLAVVLSMDSKLRHVANTFLGDRIGIEALRIADGEILIELRTRDADDPMTAITVLETRRYRLLGDRLALLESRRME